MRWRAADEGGQEAASRNGDQRRRAAEELDGGEERWRRGELQMRDEDRKLHHAVESSARERVGERRDGERRNGGELQRRGSCITQWRAEESCR